MRVALVHDWINGLRGGERVLQQFLHIYPEADIFTLFHQPGKTTFQIDQRVKKVLLLNSLPGAKRWYRLLLPLYPWAIKQFDFTGYDLVISLSHAVAKNISVAPNQKHICYCFTPIRYIWDQVKVYFGIWRYPLWPLIKLFRKWDQQTSGVTEFVGISKFIVARIRCFYRRPATVIYPPIDDFWFDVSPTEKEDYYLYAGALVPYKNVDQIVMAFNQNGKKLVIVGSGPELAKLKILASPNVSFAGRVSDLELKAYFTKAKSLVFAAKEDFGLIPIECLATGTPVIIPEAGATKETIAAVKINQANPLASYAGVFYNYHENSLADNLNLAINFFEKHNYLISKDKCIEVARNYTVARFLLEWDNLLRS